MKRGKLALIIVCFGIIGILTGVIIDQYVKQEVAIIRHENKVQINEVNAYTNLK